MKLVGAVLISIGFALLLFVAFYYLQNSNQTASPIPEDKGVKVIFVTPSQ